MSRTRKPSASSAAAAMRRGDPDLLIRSRLSALTSRIREFPQARVLVVGDLILDHFVWGKVSRISPEAPVPVVHVNSETTTLGGAANVYNNIVALGGQADICGVVGNDESGRLLLKAFGTGRAGRGGVVIAQDRPTTRKTRVVAHHQQVVRFDVESRADLSASIQRRLLRYVESRLREIHCLVVSDYAKGVITASFMTELIRLAALRKLPLLVDPKVEHFSLYKGATVITPNHHEALQAARIHGDDDQAIDQAGEIIRQRLGCQSVLITRGEKGMSLYEADGSSWHVPTMAKQVYDVTGAGDTVMGTLALAMATGASVQDGALLANQAAGLVVGMVGTATISATQLTEAVTHA
jgi:D-beta-D-heptose 7-phosphate kinase/D-beta-D-heptose 1-phosphate adenosyltransferase